MHDDQFTAMGPAHHSSGFPKTAFSTRGASNFLQGVNVQAARCGVVGEGLQRETDAPQGSSNFPGVGVEGRGVNMGVVGIGRQGAIASVFGHANRCSVGVFGAVMDRGAIVEAGVVGTSVRNMGNPLEHFKSVPEQVDGSGIGVLGSSGKGPGVRGRSAEGIGGEFSSFDGPGIAAESFTGVAVQATSKNNRAAVFQSGTNIAQINLVPLEQSSADPELPKNGNVGDILLIRNTVSMAMGHHNMYDKCSLWICIPSGGFSGGNAYWQEVKLGDPVAGTI